MEPYIETRSSRKIALALIVLAATVALIMAFAPCGAAEAKQNASSIMQHRIENGYSQKLTTIRVRPGLRITRTALQKACIKVRYKKASYMTKVASVQVWGPSGSKYASFVKVKYLNAKQQRRLLKSAKAISKRASTMTFQARKVKVIHDAINERCSYDWVSYRTGRLASNSGNAYGCLVNGKSVCAGYADAFHLVALMTGLKSVYASNGTHAWNLVKVGGKWFHIDLCWDDTGIDNSRWLLKGSDAMLQVGHHEMRSCYPKKVNYCKTDYIWPDKANVDPSRETLRASGVSGALR